MKKVLIFSLAYYPRFVGGAEIAVKEITDRLDSSKFHFHMVTLRFDSNLPKTEKIGNITIHRIGFTKKNPSMTDLNTFPLKLNKFIFQFSAFFVAIRLHKKNQFDDVWAIMAHSTGVPAGLFKTFFPKVRYVLTLQEGDPLHEIQNTMKPIYPLFVRGFRKADIIQVISTFLGNWARQMGYKGEVKVIPNGVSNQLFSAMPSEEDILTLKNQLGKKEGDVFLITTSRLVQKNGIGDVLQALKKLPSNVHFLILGIGPDEMKLKDFVSTNNLSNRVQFLGEIKHDLIPQYLHVCDIFIRPSLSEGMGNSFIEAMSAGIPVIATQVGGISDFLFDPELNSEKDPTGRAVQLNDSDGIARAVYGYIDNPATTQIIINNARDMVLKKYDWDIVAKQMTEVL